MDEYQLPNGVVINVARIVQAILSDSEYPELYLDTETGALVEIPSAQSLGQWVSEIGQSTRYFLVERLDESERQMIANDFIDLILKEELSVSKVKAARRTVASGGWAAFADFLQADDDGWIHAWDQYTNDEAWEYAHDWLTNHPHVSITPVFVGCGNCAVCDAMKQGEIPSLERLQELFANEEVMQHVRNQVTSQPHNKLSGATPVPPPTAVPAAKKVTHKSTAAKHALGAQPPASDVLVFKVTLNEVTPQVWRRIVVPAEYSFYDLHCAIQDAMGWEDAHLHMFRIDLRGKQKSNPKRHADDLITLSLPHEENDGDKDERQEKLLDWFGEETKQCVYEYDFGDGWEHTVLFEKRMPRDSLSTYPQCTHGKNACPPEDCGGVGGYDNLTQVLKDPKHADHTDMLDWLGLEHADEFDPTHFDPLEVEFDDPKASLREYEKYSGLKPL